MNRIQRIAASYLLALCLFLGGLSWGMAIGRYQVFPYEIVSEIAEFVRPDAYNDASPVGRLLSDLDVKPARYIFEYDTKSSATYDRLNVPGLRDRREKPRIRITNEAPPGYRVLFGAMDTAETFWGALLIDPDGKLAHTWSLSTDELAGSAEPAYRKTLYGVAVLPDGSIIFQMQPVGGGIVRVDYCSRPIWTIDGAFHHTVSLTDRGTFWTFEGEQTDPDHVLAEYRVDTGALVRRIDMADVRRANPTNHVFDLLRDQDALDPVHGNDIEPLPLQLRAQFPAFDPGDLLVSFKATNLVFVLDPDTLEVKWWRVGAWDTQHDPDWGADGRISVFSNNEHSVDNHSNIVAIDPTTYETGYVVKGSQYDFYSAYNGTAQITDAGSILIASSTQGRIFEVSPDGEVVFDFVNVFSEGETLHVAEGVFLGLDFPVLDKPPDCRANLS